MFDISVLTFDNQCLVHPCSPPNVWYILVLHPMPGTPLVTSQCLAHTCSPSNAWHILVLPMPGKFLFSSQYLAYSCSPPNAWHILVIFRMPGTFLFSSQCLAHSCSPPNAWHILVLHPMPGTFLFSSQCLAHSCSPPNAWHTLVLLSCTLVPLFHFDADLFQVNLFPFIILNIISTLLLYYLYIKCDFLWSNKKNRKIMNVRLINSMIKWWRLSRWLKHQNCILLWIKNNITTI